MSLLEWALENVSEWESDSVLIMTGHGREFCHPGRAFPGVEFVTRKQWQSALAAKNQPAWNGEGLPPVGCDCEVKRALEWLPCKIVFISDFHVIVQAKEEICWQTQACQFRPLRTEAERKREEFAKFLCEYLDDLNDWDSPVGKIHALAIHDAIAAGKIPHVTLN